MAINKKQLLSIINELRNPTVLVQIRTALAQAHATPEDVQAIEWDYQRSLFELAGILQNTELENVLRIFLFQRWDRIRNSTGAYVEFPENPLNIACEKIALAIAGPRESIAQILMHTLTIDYYLVCQKTLIELTENEHRKIQWHQFILNHDDSAIIPLQDWMDLQRCEQDPFRRRREYDIDTSVRTFDDPQIVHLYRMDERGESKLDGTDDYSKTYHLFSAVPLTRQDLLNLKASPIRGLADFIDAAEARENARKTGLYSAFIEFLTNCIHHGDRLKIGAIGTYEKPDEGIYRIAKVFLETHGNEINRLKTILYPIQFCDHTFKQYFHKIITGIYISDSGTLCLTEEEFDDARKSQMAICIQELADDCLILIHKNAHLFIDLANPLPRLKPLKEAAVRGLQEYEVARLNVNRFGNQSNRVLQRAKILPKLEIQSLLNDPYLDLYYQRETHSLLCEMAGIQPESGLAFKLYSTAYLRKMEKEGGSNDNEKIQMLRRAVGMPMNNDTEKRACNSTLLISLSLPDRLSWFPSFSTAPSFSQIPEPLKQRFFGATNK